MNEEIGQKKLVIELEQSLLLWKECPKNFTVFVFVFFPLQAWVWGRLGILCNKNICTGQGKDIIKIIILKLIAQYHIHTHTYI